MPLIMVNLPWWHILLAFLSMHFFTGLLVSLVFQVAHIMPSSEFPLPDEDGLIARDWPTHQFATTANYSPRSKFFSWFIGGLNYQIEHHLLPEICHVHYKKLSKIIRYLLFIPLALFVILLIFIFIDFLLIFIDFYSTW